MNNENITFRAAVLPLKSRWDGVKVAVIISQRGASDAVRAGYTHQLKNGGRVTKIHCTETRVRSSLRSARRSLGL